MARKDGTKLTEEPKIDMRSKGEFLADLIAIYCSRRDQGSEKEARKDLAAAIDDAFLVKPTPVHNGMYSCMKSRL